MLFRPLNLGILDYHTLFRKALKSYLSDEKSINVAIQASDMPDLFNKLKDFPIDVLLINMVRPDPTGNEALMRIRIDYPAVKILVISVNTDIDLISSLLDSGIHGFISSAAEPEELHKAINAVAESRIYHTRLFTEALYWNKQKNIKSYSKDNIPRLNEREKRILQMMWEEKSNKEMADDLFLGVRSIEKIRQEMKEKISVKSSVGLLKYAISKGIIGVAASRPDMI